MIRIGELTGSGDDGGAGGWFARDAPFDGYTVVPLLLPAGFAAYARVLHPASVGRDEWPVSWAHVARANGRTLHSLAQWESITGRYEYYDGNTHQPGLWDAMPEWGTLLPAEAAALAGVLAAHTATPDRCWFAVWEGFNLHPDVERLPTFALRREEKVLTGPLRAATTSLADDALSVQLPTLWWPADRAWCVSTDVDLVSTYVGGSRACIEAVLAAPGLEAVPAAPGDVVSRGADVLNPPPAGDP
ncbi:hypothetical protein GCM10010123_18750 [Pilimelia anulata]|uniref:Uncharacterized protein n=1 Tax=Pilimelia anulata TaxID=53371 RepID=A0A8J3B4Q2_9ACTN|nr:hypothetical protein [Pilimelia anulata]GGJ89338.1 hypothetical protein GCM10010123_18750 [Pilimelia anulata]